MKRVRVIVKRYDEGSTCAEFAFALAFVAIVLWFALPYAGTSLIEVVADAVAWLLQFTIF